MTNSPSNKSYFDLHITGLGYLNRIREVKPKKGDPFMACDIAALIGPTDSVEYRYFDVKVSGVDAKHLIKKCENAVAENRKVLVGFRLGDLWVDKFTYSRGEKAGQQGVSLKARLLFISWIKIDGKSVYKAAAKAVETIVAEEPNDISPGEEAPASSPPETGDHPDAEASAEAPALVASF